MIYQPAFPVEIAEYAVPLLAALRVNEQFSAKQGFVVDIQSQALSGPARVYYSPAQLRSQIGCSSGETRIPALCLGTRRWDGYIREECCAFRFKDRLYENEIRVTSEQRCKHRSR